MVLIERYARHPMLPLGLFASRERSGALVGRLFLVAGMFSSFFSSPVLPRSPGLQRHRGGARLLAHDVVMFAMSRVVRCWHLALGPAACCSADWRSPSWGWGGSAGSRRAPATSRRSPSRCCSWGGVGIAFITLTGRAITGVADRDAGARLGLVTSSAGRRLLGIAVLTTVFVSATHAGGGESDAHVLATGSPPPSPGHRLHGARSSGDPGDQATVKRRHPLGRADRRRDAMARECGGSQRRRRRTRHSSQHEKAHT